MRSLRRGQMASPQSMVALNDGAGRPEKSCGGDCEGRFRRLEERVARLESRDVGADADAPLPTKIPDHKSSRNKLSPNRISSRSSLTSADPDEDSVALFAKEK